MSAIFISYRRADSGGHAGRLFDRLRHWFGEGSVFFDLDGIDAGRQFPQRLDEAVHAAQVVLVLIGPDWLTTLRERANRQGVDYVRREVATALRLRTERGSPQVVPVLFGVASVPDLAGLPDDLRAEFAVLRALDAHEFRGKQSNWDNQFVRLRDLIARQPGVPAPRFRAGRHAAAVPRHRSCAERALPGPQRPAGPAARASKTGRWLWSPARRSVGTGSAA